MAHVFWFLLIITPGLAVSNILPLLTPVVAAMGDGFPAPVYYPPTPTPPPPSGCSSKCGDTDIPYPFGIIGGYGHNCSRRGAFNLTCNTSFYPARVYLDNVEVVNISLEAGEMRVYGSYAHVCSSNNRSNDSDTGGAYEPATTLLRPCNRSDYYGRSGIIPEVAKTIMPIGGYSGSGQDEYSGITPDDAYSTTLDLTNSPYLISAVRNEFTAIGCNTLALLKGREDWSYNTGCITYCTSLDDAAHDGDDCTGLGCCQTSISGNLTMIQVSWSKGTMENNPAHNYSPCSYAFVAEKGKDDGSCQLREEAGKAPAAPTASACVSLHSYCVNATQGPGYLCKCSSGYTGNPYIKDGCTNINECELRKLDPAQYGELYPCGSASTCYDSQGGYVCKCKFGYRGNGKSDKGCQPIVPIYAIAIVATFVASIVVFFMIMELKRRKQKKFFDKNGGEILQSMNIKIFTERQMKKITNGYSTPIGEGSFGKVFMGIIGTDQKVSVKCAIMKAKQVLPKEEFVNEIIFQFRIRHPNLVRLVGCCLETYVPMLVFEFVPKGSLYNMLHGPNMPNKLLLPVRLDIAIGSAEALTYMHSHSGNHVHGDVKSGNILLDENLRPKVSDFGSSKLVSITSKYTKWCVSGDMNYIDPVYLKCGRFTEKSDVYSFGVVLLELITGKTAKYGDNSLPIDFVKSCKVEGNGRKMFDPEIISDPQCLVNMECLDRMGALAVRCIKEDVDERPTMAEVVEELKEIKLTACGGPCSERQVEGTYLEEASKQAHI